jgi:hypothetical protein
MTLVIRLPGCAWNNLSSGSREKDPDVHHPASPRKPERRNSEMKTLFAVSYFALS